MPVTSENVSDLAHLADEFSFSDLQREIATWSLSTLFSSECFLFLAEWDTNQPQRARLDQPVFNGYDEPRDANPDARHCLAGAHNAL
jgi:hypothetical protein